MEPVKATDMILKANLNCPYCYKKIKRILGDMPQVSNQVFDEKHGTVNITVCCNPEMVREKIAMKGGKAVQEIKIKEPPKPKPKEEAPKTTAENSKPKEVAKTTTDDNKPKGDNKPKEEAKTTKGDDKPKEEAKMISTDNQKPKVDDKPKEEAKISTDNKKPKGDDKPKGGDDNATKTDKPKEAPAPAPAPVPVAVPVPVAAAPVTAPEPALSSVPAPAPVLPPVHAPGAPILVPAAMTVQAPMGYPYYMPAYGGYNYPGSELEPSYESGYWKPVPVSDNYGYYGYDQGDAYYKQSYNYDNNRDQYLNEENPSACTVM